MQLADETKNKLARLRYLNECGEADEASVSDEMQHSIRTLRTELVDEFLPVIRDLVEVGLLAAASYPDAEPEENAKAWDVVEAVADGSIWLFLGDALILAE